MKEIVPNNNVKLNQDVSREYEFIGMIVGKAIYENVLI